MSASSIRGEGNRLLILGPLEMRLDERDLIADGNRASVTVREFQVLEALAGRPDRVVARDASYDHVWGGPMPNRDRAVDVHVRRLRAKLADAAPAWRFIHTHFGIGYRLAPETRAASHEGGAA